MVLKFVPLWHSLVLALTSEKGGKTMSFSLAEGSQKLIIDEKITNQSHMIRFSKMNYRILVP